MKPNQSLRCRICLGALVAGFIGACSVEDGVLGRVYGAPGGGTGINGGAAGAAGAAVSRPGYCSPTSPSVTMPGVNGYSTCTGRIAAATFNNALCTCNGVQLRQGLTTVGFDSVEGAYVPGQGDDSGAAVGINGAYATIAGYTDVGGSLSIAGTDEVNFVGYLVTRGDLRVAGNVEVAGYTSVARNAWLGGSFTGWGPFTVTGELHHAQAVSAFPLSAPADRLEPVTIFNPCPCEPEQLRPIEQLVETSQQQNDNLAYGIDVQSLTAVSSDAQLALPCGKFYLSQISGTGNVVVRVGGMTALFIDGSISLNGSLQIELAPGAEIDIFVKGSLAVAGSITLGTQERPAASRLFVAGADDIVLNSPFVGNLYAPRARVLATGRLDVYGSIFA
ncbi:MAG: hypothetical protein ACM3ZE_07575, partial [Myxococcales bacterium]